MGEIDWASLRKRADDATRPPEPGTYVIEVTKADNRINSSGNPMIATQMKIIEGPAAGKTVFNNFNLTVDNDFAMLIFFRHMAAFGLDDKFFAGNPSLDALAQSLVGRRARAELSIRQWQNQDRPQVDNLTPLTGAGPPLPTIGSPVPAGPPIPSGAPPVPITPVAAPSSATIGPPPTPPEHVQTTAYPIPTPPPEPPF